MNGSSCPNNPLHESFSNMNNNGTPSPMSTLAATAFIAATLGSAATVFLLRRLQNQNKSESELEQRRSQLLRRLSSRISSDLGGYSSAREIFTDSELDLLASSANENDIGETAPELTEEEEKTISTQTTITRKSSMESRQNMYKQLDLMAYGGVEEKTSITRHGSVYSRGSSDVASERRDSSSMSQQQRLLGGHETPPQSQSRDMSAPQSPRPQQEQLNCPNQSPKMPIPAQQLRNYPNDNNNRSIFKPHQRQSSTESEASDIPSDEWFERLVGDTDRPSTDDLEEEFHNKSGNSEYIDRDRVGSLGTVRRSIMKRKSLLCGNVPEEDNAVERCYYCASTPMLPFPRRRSSVSDVVHFDAADGEAMQQHESGLNKSSVSNNSTTSSTSCACSQTSAIRKYRRPSFEPHVIQRRRSSVHNRRRFSKTGNVRYPSMERTNSISTIDTLTCGDDDEVPEATFSFEQQQSPFGKRPTVFTEEDSYISETERQFKGEEGFETVTELARDFPSSLHLLRRTRAISALAHRLMAAPDEAACIEEVTRLMVIIFGLNRVSFAMSTGSDHFLLKRVEVKRNEKDVSGAASAASMSSTTLDLDYLDSDYKRPYEGTAAGIVAKTLKEHYTPRTKESHFATHKVFYKQGLNSVLATPILVNGNQCMGVILLSRKEEDAFPKPDRVLISDIATLLGANIYAKRLRKSSEEANKLSREMLYSFVPPKVLEKIEGFWDANSEKYKQLKSSLNKGSSTGSPESSFAEKSSIEGGEMVRSNSWFVANTDWSEVQIQEHLSKQKPGVRNKLDMLKKLNRGESFAGDDNTGIIITEKGMDLESELNMTSKALYAENRHNVSIIFTDIVGFSKIAMGVTPIRVMNMLQNLFSRFDKLCDVHGVMKLETIGDAYLAATNLLEENASSKDVARDAAARALAMAKDMVREARNVRIPFSRDAVHLPWTAHSFDEVETLEIRVGIHVGDITCGVLGQRLPKFTICGTTVNLAARMEQTSRPSHIRVTEDFHDLVGENETGWFQKETIAIKNMGTVDSYLLDPLQI